MNTKTIEVKVPVQHANRAGGLIIDALRKNVIPFEFGVQGAVQDEAIKVRRVLGGYEISIRTDQPRPKLPPLPPLPRKRTMRPLKPLKRR